MSYQILYKINQFINQFKVFLGGDYNTVMDPLMDKTTKTNVSPNTLALRNLISDYGLLDIWRTHNPTTREYTFIRADVVPSQG